MDESEVKAYFDSASETYRHDQTITEIDALPAADRFLEDCPVENPRVLEVGCGTGRMLEYLIASGSGTEIYGVDISPEMLPTDDEAARAGYVIGSATDLPFQPGSFDAVFCRDLLHHVVGNTRRESRRKAQAVLSEASALLCDGGQLVIKDIFYHSPVGPDVLTSYAIFHGLKHFQLITSMIDEEAADGLLVSFYTRDELVEMIQRAGMTIVKEELVPGSRNSLPRKLLIDEVGCIRLYARKDTDDGRSSESAWPVETMER